MILIVGGHPDYQDKIPDHSERWVMAKSFDRDADRVFEMHKPVVWEPRIPHLNEFDCPVYMQRAYTDVRMSVAYPIKDVERYVGRNQTSTIAYMIALALYEGEDVAVWGVGGDTELYTYQTPNIAYLAGLASADGQTVIAHPDSALSRILNPAARYGYDGEAHLYDPTQEPLS